MLLLLFKEVVLFCCPEQLVPGRHGVPRGSWKDDILQTLTHTHIHIPLTIYTHTHKRHTYASSASGHVPDELPQMYIYCTYSVVAIVKPNVKSTTSGTIYLLEAHAVFLDCSFTYGQHAAAVAE